MTSQHERAGEGADVNTDASRHVDIAVHGSAGVIAFGRCTALNALTDAMRTAIAAAVPRFARDPQVYAVLIRSNCPRAFSAGGDVRELARLGRSDPAELRASLAREYGLNWLLECFSKPTVSLIDGIVMGSGVGISIYGTHRVAGEGYRFAMPETALGFFPDDGLAHVFARMPDHIGMYLGLTGRQIGRADALALGLVTHCVPSSRFADIEAGLGDADTVDALLDGCHVDPGPAPILEHRSAIGDWFSGDSVWDIAGRLSAAARGGGDTAHFAQGVLDDLARLSPTSLAVTFRHISEARALDLRQTLVRDYRLAIRLIEGGDFYEGVRALIIDKDRRPRWRPETLAEVSPGLVERYFAAQPGEELVLPTRQEMQAARV